ncbi:MULTISPECIES: TadE/TadG family type IV pilus assembly protein [Nocardiopsis]|uniref:Pilus assembly protein TadG-related protein n=1 Tax=Nocardiopsis lambiniae TaxID=3075539 RepID=A0ABU2MES2_9ACTN|nr:MULTISPECIES: pilus assembly protein TadG-related protein [unclassified Nocardiopsis]MDE3721967.1 pilus assembly protein TadG-related protein [Nocardiopsis sp. N85]MDT0331186.1 pilus assembly protein TadG-related protein [Nocardiopsis sp. DSM 44743]
MKTTDATDDRGQVTAFVAIMALSFIVCLGLVYEGGELLQARRQTATLAQEAARVGVQQIDWDAYREGAQEVPLDGSAAVAAAQAFLAAAGATGTVTVSGDSVTVTCTLPYSFTLIPAGSTTVETTATARPYTQATP